MLRIALPTGRMLEQAIQFLSKFDRKFLSVEQGRRLCIQGDKFEVFLAKPWDLPLYVEEKVVDLGIIGKDIILEQEKKVVNLVSLPFGYCKMVLAGFPQEVTVNNYENGEVVIATKYVNITKKFFENKWNKLKIIKLNGSVELGPLLKISHYIVDLMETGKTLKENGLEVKEVIFESSACLIANTASFTCKRKQIIDFIREVETL